MITFFCPYNSRHLSLEPHLRVYQILDICFLHSLCYCAILSHVPDLVCSPMSLLKQSKSCIFFSSPLPSFSLHVWFAYDVHIWFSLFQVIPFLPFPCSKHLSVLYTNMLYTIEIIKLISRWCLIDNISYKK